MRGVVYRASIVTAGNIIQIYFFINIIIVPVIISIDPYLIRIRGIIGTADIYAFKIEGCARSIRGK